MPTFEGLRVWQEAYKLSLMAYRATGKFPAAERYGLTAQMRRAAVSVGANIAEGQRRKTKKDFSNFLVIAEGSLAEVQHYLLLARDLEFIDEGKFRELHEQAGVVEKMLVGLERSLK